MIDLVHLAIMAALDRKDGLLFKGALVRWQGNPLIISGVSGAGKTSLLLQMLNDGWHYLADNTFLAHEGKAFDFRTKIVFHDYHTQAFSNIFERSRLTLQSQRQLERRSQLRQWTTRHLPSSLLKNGRLNKALNPYRAHKATDIFPELETFRDAESQMVLLLLVGKHLSFEPVEPERAIHQLKLMHQMAWCEFDEINRLTEINTGKALYQFERTIRANTAGKQFFALTIPYRADTEAPYKFLIKKLSTAFAHVYGHPLSKEVDA